MGSRLRVSFLIAVSLVQTVYLSDVSAEEKLPIFRYMVPAQGKALQFRGIAQDSDDDVYTIVNENDIIQKYSLGNYIPIITDVAANVTTDMEPLIDQFDSPLTKSPKIWNWLFGDRISPISYLKRRFMTENIWRG
jgi:hypothetical protein